jgi:homoserine dehydrogenase
LARLLTEKREELASSHGLQWRVTGIHTRRHGSIIDPEGIDLALALRRMDGGQSLESPSSAAAPADGPAFIRACKGDVLFENTPVNYESGQPAVDHLRTALQCDMHAITANKGPVVHAYVELSQLAARRNLRFLFESAVMDGAPIFSLWRETLPAAVLQSFRGILNSTTNLMLTLMESGDSFEQAIARAQALGIAETDPGGDISGMDSAVKVAALVTVLMGFPFKPHQVERMGIESIPAEEVRSALGRGRRWKLICQAQRAGSEVTAFVRPEQVDVSDPLYSVMGTSSAVTFHSDVLESLTLVEGNPGPDTTAYGLLADLLRAVALRG